MDEETSYLRARDPSIVLYSYNRTGLAGVKIKLDSLMSTTSDNSNSQTNETEVSKDAKYINVYLRIKGDTEFCNDVYGIDNNTLICKVPEGCRNLKSGDRMKKMYSFTSIYGPDVKQTDIFDQIVKPKLLSVINARNSTLFTYGASGSGKTYTIVGTPEEPGLIPRALEYLFRSIPKLKEVPEVKPLPNGHTKEVNENTILEMVQKKAYIINATLTDQSAHMKTYMQMQKRLSSEPVAEIEETSDVLVSAWVSFSEIYNEKVYDLLIPPAPQGKQRPTLALGKTRDENTYIKNLTLINVSDGLEAYQVLQYGLHNLNYAATAVNSHSSRSHCIFTIKLVQSSKRNSDIYVSSFNFCDLAGAERLKKTMNFGDRLKESNNINTSLLVLGRCMENIRKNQQIRDNKLIPFRDSKLTQIFQKALMGRERVNMIVNINPSREMFDETIHVLNFSAIAKTIIVDESEPTKMRKKTRFSLMVDRGHATKSTNQFLKVEDIEIRQLRLENQRLRNEQQARACTNDTQEELQILRLENQRLIDAFEEERDNIIAAYEQKLLDETERVANIYKDSIARREKAHQENKEFALQRLRMEYESKLAEMEVITITSESSEDEEEEEEKLTIPAERELLKRIEELEQKNITLMEENDDLRGTVKDKETLLEEAAEEYLYWKAEALRCHQAYENILKEKMRMEEGCDNIRFDKTF